MNAKRQLSGLKRVDFSNKTDRQKINYLVKKYELLGYSIPSYLQGKSLTQRQLTQAVNKITTGLNSVIKKEIALRKSHKNSIDFQYNQTIKKYNREVDKTLQALETMGLSSMQINYLKGKDLFLTYYDKKSFIYDGIPLEHLDNIYIADNKTKKEMIKKFKQDMKDIKFMNVYKKLTDSTENDNWFNNEFMSSPSIQLGCKPYVQEMIRKEYNSLTPLQKDMWIKEVLRDLRDRYPEDSVIGNEERIETNIYDTVTKSIQKYKTLKDLKGVYD